MKEVRRPISAKAGPKGSDGDSTLPEHSDGNDPRQHTFQTRENVLSKTPAKEIHVAASALHTPSFGLLFRDWLTPERIIDALASRWAKLVCKRDKWHRWEQDCPRAVQEPTNPLPDIYPPVSSGHTIAAKIRRSISEETLRSEIATLMELGLKNGEPSAWAINLRHEVEAIRKRALDPDLSLESPRVVPTFPDKSDLKKIRVLAIYTLQDSVIISLASRFLSEQIDPFLSRSSVAYRIAPDRNAVAALREIQAINASSRNTPLFVAECDIRSCFDVVPHDTICRAVTGIAERMAAHGKFLDPQIRTIIIAYLRTYSFPENVISVCPQAKEKWFSPELLALHSSPLETPLGVPQGGALSGQLINIVLDLADRAMEVESVDYWRYSDDSIIISEDPSACEAALAVYLKNLADLRLPVHPFANPKLYVKKEKIIFWESKSKEPYSWGNNAARGEYPWLSFLGFQFKRDLIARLRPDAVEKRKRKISALAAEVIANYKRSIGRGRKPIDPERIIRSFRYRVLASSFGRNWDNTNGEARNDRSWYGWTGQLHRWPHDRKFLKLLDRHFRHGEARIRNEIGVKNTPRRMTSATEYRVASFFQFFRKIGFPHRDDARPDYSR